MKMYLVLLLALVASCTKNPASVSKTDNKAFSVELLFTHEGCKVYRFQDGNDRYYTNCSSTFWSESYQCGKSRCTRPEGITTTKENK